MITDSDRKLVERVWRAVFGHSPIVIDLDDVYGAGFGISIAGFDVCPKAAPDPFDIGRMISDGCITSNHLVMTLDGPVPASEVSQLRATCPPAEGRDADADVARALLASPESYATAAGRR